MPPAQLCDTFSSANPDGLPASYLDVYKNEVANAATGFGLPKGVRPAVFAFHGWHDTNSYLDRGDHCGTYETCTVRRVLRSLDGTWSGTDLWDTEDGSGQTSAQTDDAQACGAAFLLRLLAVSPRVKRLYITRLHGGVGQLLVAHGKPRPALGVFAKRAHFYTAGSPCP